MQCKNGALQTIATLNLDTGRSEALLRSREMHFLWFQKVVSDKLQNYGAP